MAGEHDKQGTGRHPHKDAQDPRPHTKEEGRQGAHRGSTGHRGSENVEQHQSASSPRGSEHNDGRAEEADLKRREYRDEKGEVHHHTKSYMEQHGKK